MPWIALISLMMGTSGKFFEHREELLNSVQCGEFVKQLRNYKLLKRDSTP